MSFIESLPKVELHRHFELCMRKETMLELAPQVGSHITSEQAYKDEYLILEPMKDLSTVLKKFLVIEKFFSSEEIIERVAFECCEDAYKKENIFVLELRYAPTFVQSQNPHLSFAQIHEAIVKGVSRAEKEFPIAVGIICLAQRTLPVEMGAKVIDFAIDAKDTVVGVDLADSEVGFEPKPFKEVFQKAKKAGLGVTIHAGEADVPEASKYVQDAIDHLGAVRIGHGLQIIKDPTAIEYVKKQDIILELCPVSNWLTNAISSFDQHPFKKLMDMGVKTCISADDPGIFYTDLNREYKILEEHNQLQREDFEKCNQFAFEKSFIPKEKKEAVWTKALKRCN